MRSECTGPSSKGFGQGTIGGHFCCGLSWSEPAQDRGIGANTKGERGRAGADDQDRCGGRCGDGHGCAEPGVDDDAVGKVGSEGDCRPDVGAGNAYVS